MQDLALNNQQWLISLKTKPMTENTSTESLKRGCAPPTRVLM